MKFFLQAFSYATHSIWKDKTSNCEIFAAAKKAYSSLQQNCTKSRHFFRLAGQSGSGKTSQLFASHNAIFEKSRIKPMHIAVRNFAHFHPDFEKLKNSSNFREATNGFALKVLICVLDKAMHDGCDIILEIALLDKRFEKFIVENLIQQNYKVCYHILCVNKLLSDSFILKRKANTKRLTLSKSSDYFYKIMPKSMKYLKKYANFQCFLWSPYDLSPIYSGNLNGCYSVFLKRQKQISPLIYSEQQMLEFKILFLAELYRDVLV